MSSAWTFFFSVQTDVSREKISQWRSRNNHCREDARSYSVSTKISHLRVSADGRLYPRAKVSKAVSEKSELGGAFTSPLYSQVTGGVRKLG